MRRDRTITFSLPPFEGWVRRIIVACAGVYLLQVILSAFSPEATGFLFAYFGLTPAAVMHGYLWQLATYSLLHAGLGHIFFNMLTVWFIGGWLERDWGSRRFIECYVFCVVGAALVTIAVAYTGFLGMRPTSETVGASGGIFGLLMAFGILYADQEMFMFPLPFMIKAKYLVGIWIFIALVATFQPSQGGVANFAHLGGLLFGFLYVKLMPRRGVVLGASEKYFSWRNSYYRWKRRRAARKFEVYMRKHDRNVNFDEYGNYVPPDEDKKNGGSKSGWVN
ncbi:MAG TPA: rhomboid family intramembrane serine protease [Terriglobales bacterium]|nr:rhomboid family intramembrane serine protease [Terriglobales bacterium]